MLVDHADDDLVGHQLAGVHEVLHLEARRRALRHRGPEDIAGGQVLDAVVRGEERSLRPLARAGLAEQHEAYAGDSHGQVRKPS